MGGGVNVDANLVIAASTAFLQGPIPSGGRKNPGLDVSVALRTQLTFLPAFTAE
jgi:hypothetical protein